MTRWECAILEKFTTGPLLGFSFYEADELNNWTEFNLYLIFFVIHFKFFNNGESLWFFIYVINFMYYRCINNITFKLNLWKL